jgi:hypothetical protein
MVMFEAAKVRIDDLRHEGEKARRERLARLARKRRRR